MKSTDTSSSESTLDCGSAARKQVWPSVPAASDETLTAAKIDDPGNDPRNQWSVLNEWCGRFPEMQRRTCGSYPFFRCDGD